MRRLLLTVLFVLLTCVGQAVSRRIKASESQGNEQDWWVAKLTTVLELNSTLDREQTALTVVLPLSLERWRPVEFHCELYSNMPHIALSASLYIPLWEGVLHSRYESMYDRTPLKDLLGIVTTSHRKLTEKGCVVDISVFTEEVPEHNEFYSYPINAIRNKALQYANTKMVALLDGDFVFGPVTFAKRFYKGNPEFDSVMDILINKSVMVMPAFRLLTDDLSEVTLQKAEQVMHNITSSKVQLEAEYKKSIIPFHKEYHKNTKYDVWWKSTDPYEIDYIRRGQDAAHAFEPYLLALKQGLPCYDERYRGHFYNKMAFCYNVYLLGFRFIVHPSSYVVHYPHEVIRDHHAQKEGKYRFILKRLAKTMHQEFEAGRYHPFVADQTCQETF